jgi:hypothetical protein
MDIERRTLYPEPRWRGQPGCPVLIYALPTVDDQLAARLYATRTVPAEKGEGGMDRPPKEELDTERYALALAARILRFVRNVEADGEPVVWRRGLPIEELVEAFNRLIPHRWAVPLVAAAESEADLDPEEESGG